MRTKDEMLMMDIVAAVDGFFSQTGRTPTTRELGTRLGLSASTMSRYLQEMNERGMLEYDGGKITMSELPNQRKIRSAFRS